MVNSTSIGSGQILIASGEKVLLQKLQMFLFRWQTEQQLWQGFLLDSTSHRTFMTEKLSKEFKFQSQCKELLSVLTFGTKNPQDVDTYGTAHVQVYKQTHVTHHASRNFKITCVLGLCDMRNILLTSDY